MPILFAGSSISDFDHVGLPALDTTPSRLSPNVSEGFLVVGNNMYCQASIAPVANYWLSFYDYYSSPFSTQTRVRMGNQANPNIPGMTDHFTIWNFGGEMRFLLDGVQIGNIPTSTSAVFRYDIRFRTHASAGIIEVYRDNSLVFSWTGDSDSVPTINSIRFEGSDNGSGHFYSGIILSTGDSRILSLYQMDILGEGSINEWNGDYTLIDEPGKADDTFMWTDVPGDVTLFDFDKPAIPSGHFVGAIVFNSVTSKYGDVADGIEAIQYHDGIAEVMGDVNTGDVVFSSNRMICEVNPITGVRYTTAEYTDFEFGLQSF